jgi:hypothetical protein
VEPKIIVAAIVAIRKRMVTEAKVVKKIPIGFAEIYNTLMGQPITDGDIKLPPIDITGLVAVSDWVGLNSHAYWGGMSFSSLLAQFSVYLCRHCTNLHLTADTIMFIYQGSIHSRLMPALMSQTVKLRCRSDGTRHALLQRLVCCFISMFCLFFLIATIYSNKPLSMVLLSQATQPLAPITRLPRAQHLRAKRSRLSS